MNKFILHLFFYIKNKKLISKKKYIKVREKIIKILEFKI